MALEHGHLREEIAGRLAAPKGRGHLRDFVYADIGGTVTTFAIVARVAGARRSHGVIVALGIANVLADGFSMAAGNYSGTVAGKEDAARLKHWNGDISRCARTASASKCARFSPRRVCQATY